MARWMDAVLVRQNVEYNNLVEKVNELKAMRRRRKITITKRLIMKKGIMHPKEDEEAAAAEYAGAGQLPGMLEDIETCEYGIEELQLYERGKRWHRKKGRSGSYLGATGKSETQFYCGPPSSLV